MPEITLDESLRQIRTLTRRAEQTADEGRWADAVDRWRAVLAHPCAHHQVVDYEVLDEIHQTWRRAGQYDDAIAAKREAIVAGYRSVPDPEADIAECLLAAGRREEADGLFAKLHDRDPDGRSRSGRHAAARVHGGRLGIPRPSRRRRVTPIPCGTKRIQV